MMSFNRDEMLALVVIIAGTNGLLYWGFQTLTR